jgi:hypothetical protein
MKSSHPGGRFSAGVILNLCGEVELGVMIGRDVAANVFHRAVAFSVSEYPPPDLKLSPQRCFKSWGKPNRHHPDSALGPPENDHA